MSGARGSDTTAGNHYHRHASCDATFCKDIAILEQQYGRASVMSGGSASVRERKRVSSGGYLLGCCELIQIAFLAAGVNF